MSLADYRAVILAWNQLQEDGTHLSPGEEAELAALLERAPVLGHA